MIGDVVRCGVARPKTGESAIRRPLRRHQAEQLPLSPQILDFDARLTAAGEHQRRIVQDRGTVSEPAQREQARTPNDSVPATWASAASATAHGVVVDSMVHVLNDERNPCTVQPISFQRVPLASPERAAVTPRCPAVFPPPPGERRLVAVVVGGG